MGLVGAVPALLLPLLAGMVVVRCLLPARLGGGWALVPAAGLVVGVLVTGLAMAATAALAPGSATGIVAGVLAVLAAAALGAARLFPRIPGLAAPAVDPLGPLGARLAPWLAALLVLVLAANFWLMVGEVLERPLLGWDAWRVWAVRPLIWTEYSALVEFVSPAAWDLATDPAVHTVPGYQYPELLGRFQLWCARWIGGWDDAGVFLAWPLLWLALHAAFLGLLRLVGTPWPAALLGTLLLACAPFPAVHAMLPGYMDLWIAVELLIAVGLLALWLETRSARLLPLAGLMLVALPLTKLEGLVWAVLVALAFGLATRPPAQVLRILAATVGVAVVWALGGGVGWNVGGIEIAIRPDRIVIPYLGAADLAFENRLGAFSEALFALPNWHVLAVVGTIAILLLLGRAWPPLRVATGLFVLFAALFLLVLFNFTPAGYWAEDLTASNRLTLHAAPAALWLLLAAYARNGRSEASSST